MARPCKSAAVLTDCSQTKDEIKERIKKEEVLRGLSDRITPPPYLNEKQAEIFRYIVEELRESGILGNLDVFILAQCSVAIDRLQTIDGLINETPSMLSDKSVLSARDSYTKDLYRCCNELSLSPQSRAKMANINLQSKKAQEDPILRVLRGGKG